MDPIVPKQIGRYAVDRLLGAGAMGYVFLGRDPELDRAVAIKTLRNLGMDEEGLARFLERFRNEARAAARLHHPNIVQVYDVGEDEVAGPYLVFEYVAGSTLKQLLRDRGPLSPESVCRLAAEVGDALMCAHERGIIHRDIKPDNLLMSPGGVAKLADFGVARVPNAALTREGQFLGTPCYAAPETLSEGRYGVHSDLFSFGALLYEVVTGARAFPGTDAVAVAHSVIHDEPTPAREAAKGVKVPKGVEAVLTRALSKDPDARYETAHALSDALRAAYVAAGLVREATTSHRTGKIQLEATTSPPEESSSSALAFGAVLLGCLLIGVAVIFAMGGDEPLPPPPLDAGVSDMGAPDMGVPDAGAGDEVDSGREHRSGHDDEDAGVDDQGVVEAADAGAETTTDAGAGAQAGDAGAADGPDTMTSHEREEAAKDALDDARRHLRNGELDGARAAVARAARLDPENDDIAGLRAAIAVASGDDAP